MRIRLDRIGEEGFGWREELLVRPEDLGRPEVLELGELVCDGRLTLAPPGFLLRATFTYDQTVACGRCLKPTACPVAGALELLLMVEEEPAGVEEERELDEGDLGVLHLPEPVLETEPLFVEQVQLNVPMKVLCREGCAGLCGQCGADLNLGPCGCPAPADPRWAALAQVKSRMGEG